MFDIIINGTNIRYADGEISAVHIQFQGNDSERAISLSGYIPLTANEYQGNESLDALKVIVRTKLVERLQTPAE
ncbi:hypothetical protein [Cytobacillus kochii]|uniref:hypothetical protein n=1 Tax=Cytobacillus kochii TaxID=859143 RepID=UPI003F80E2F5